MDAFIPPPVAVFEVTNDEFFAGENLVDKKFTDIQAEVARIGSFTPPEPEMANE